MEGEAGDLQSLLVGFCKAGRTLDKYEVAQCEQLAELVKGHLKTKALELMRASHDRPLLFSYANDAMSIAVHCEAHAAGVGQSRITRKGKMLHELLMQRGMLKAGTVTGVSMAVILADPVPLTLGKKAVNCFAAACKFFPMPRKAGHRHICVTHVAFDRALLAPLDRLLRQRRAAFYSPAHGPDLGGDAPLLALMDWHVTTGCCLHDASNGLKWGMFPFTAPGLLEDLHISIESLRNSFGFIHPHIGAFLSRCLKFEAPSGDKDEVRQFWSMLGVEPHWLDELCDLNPHWRDGSLWVSSEVQQGREGFDRVASMMMYMLKWKQFSSTRWATVGSSCRYLMKSLCVGLDELVRLTKAGPHVSGYHINGFAKCGRAVRKYACIASMGSFPLEAFLLEVMEDDRVCRHLPALEECVQDELACVERMSRASWDRLASVVQGCSATELQSGSLFSAHASVAFLSKRVFQVAKAYPWKLTLGNVAANLQALADSDAPVADPTTTQIKSLLSLGYNREALSDAVSLLREVPWSTLGVEQAHGSVACIHKLHHGCGAETIACRSLLHQARHLFVAPPEAKAEERARAKTQRLQRSVKRSVSARNLFYKDFMTSAKTHVEASGSAGAIRAREALIHSQRLFDSLDPASAQAYSNLARQATQERAMRLQADIEHEAATLRLRQARVESAAIALGKTNHTSNCRFDNADFAAMQAQLDAGMLSRSAVQALRAQCQEPPGNLSPQQQTVLDAYKVEPLVRNLPLPDWAKQLCNNRDEFRGCALMADPDDRSSKAYLLMYALQNPLVAMFLELHPAEATVPAIAGVPLDQLGDVLQLNFVHNYTYTQSSYCQAQDLPFDSDGAGAFVLEDLSFIGGNRLGSDFQVVPWDVFAARLPPTTTNRAEAKPKAASKRRIDPELLRQYPWLADYVAEATPEACAEEAEAPAQEQARAQQAIAIAAMADAEKCTGLSDEAVDKAWVDLEERRELMGLTAPEVGDNFHTQLKGAARIAATADAPFDTVLGVAKAGAPNQWAIKYHLGKSASFSAKKYGDYAAHVMALEWCRRCEFFYQMWCSQKAPDYIYTPEDFASYDEDESWQSFMFDLDVGTAAFMRASNLVALRPKLA